MSESKDTGCSGACRNPGVTHQEVSWSSPVLLWLLCSLNHYLELQYQYFYSNPMCFSYHLGCTLTAVQLYRTPPVTTSLFLNLES
ncbi:hypothetical protein AV530_015419 [Patagioenas fasciata monilis]|uniref:Uncharacterized protein n=1 Tax=Patagioenas fasciata monilis TaxID=372326 RepID=A0A1V4JV85_PATFA|nr:hypothetical protein AV530_015419 [Patagioenas fasciata monilis]